MKYNIVSFGILSCLCVLLGCTTNYNGMNDHQEPEKLINEETKLDSYVNCKFCPSCNQDYRYFYVCSHGWILMVCNECETPYDVSYEARLSNEKHKIKISECFSNNHRVATKSDLGEAGLGDYINKLGLLDEEDDEE